MAKQKTFSLIATITANNESDAEDVRAELVGPVEDAREGSSIFPAGADANIGDLVELDLDAVLTAYREFHDTQSNLVEEGCFIGFKDGHPNEYKWMVDAMAKIAGMDPKKPEPIQADAPAPFMDRLKAFQGLMAQAIELGFCVTDFIDAEDIAEDYKLTFEQALEVLPLIDIGDYDANCIHANAGSSDGRREVLDAAVEAAGFGKDDEEDEDPGFGDGE